MTKENVSIFDLPEWIQEMLPAEKQLLIKNKKLEEAENEIDRLQNELNILQEQLEQRGCSG